ncbi:hypothetical protein D5018_17610 [Parashewanella curva]|uniref:Uncharacterized protein n=1 Tax=Parashewanella curva TaxID=2338552 RepID=A0A3L8PSM6_9GAMM|nr:hypothetical protein [Parashewanella curva]RLV58366.1 hypothetical protein D5018_17610 [Parashewanella curva]
MDNVKASSTYTNQNYSVAELAIQSMRAMLGQSSLASHYDKLTKEQKIMLLIQAGINSQLFWDYQFEQFNPKQRNDIRHAIIFVTDTANEFSGVNLSKEQCHFSRHNAFVATNSKQSEVNLLSG